jgi:hypothetical protein
MNIDKTTRSESIGERQQIDGAMCFRAKAMDDDLAIKRKGRWAHEPRQLSGCSTPREIHLKEAILRMKKSERAGDVFPRRAADRRDAQSIAGHLDRCRQAAELMTAIELRKARAQLAPCPECAHDSRGEEHKEYDEQPFEETTHVLGML